MWQLNPPQQQVVEELDRNILLLASAGTGKTNTLAHRVAHILTSQRAKAEQVLCMTFTNKACREMNDRIVSIAGADARAVDVLTFHSFCYKVLREEGKRGDGLFQDVIIFDEEDTKDLLEPHRLPSLTLLNLQNLVSTLKEYRTLWGHYSDSLKVDYQRTIDQLQAEKPDVLRRFFSYGAEGDVGVVEFSEMGAAMMESYEQELAALQGVDFADLITKVHRLFQDPDVVKRWQHRYTYIAVDEMQDTSDLEYEVMQCLWEGNHVLLCGDYFQTIYEWRGSNPLPLLETFRNRFNPITIVFYENYRANQLLFNASFGILKNMFPDLVKAFYEEDPYAAQSQEGSPIVLHEAPTEWKEAAFIYDEIRRLQQTHGTDASIGVLVRNNYKAQSLSRLFSRFNQNCHGKAPIEFLLVDEFKFFRRQEIKDVMAYFKLLGNPRDRVSAKRMMKRFVKGVGDARIEALESEETRCTGLGITDFLQYAIFEEEPYEALLEGMNTSSVVVFDVESTGVNTLQDYVIQIGAIRIDKEGRELETFERFIKPPVPVGDSEAVHGFSDEYLAAHGEEASVVLKAFREFVKDTVVVGHNVNYDMAIMSTELGRQGMEALPIRGVYDTLDMYRRFYPNLVNHKLGTLSATFPIEHIPTHNAMDDIRATAQLLAYIVKENIEPTQPMRRAIIQQNKSEFAGIASHMAVLRRKMETEKPTDVLTYIMKDMGVLTYYQQKQEMARVEHIRDLYRLLKVLEEEEPEGQGTYYVQRILELAALTAGEVGGRWKEETRIPIITVHQAKGSEFDYVFLAGLNEGTFPNGFAVKEGKGAEEQRLFYVAVTRAKAELYMTYAIQAGQGKLSKRSSLLQYVPKEYIVQR